MAKAGEGPLGVDPGRPPRGQTREEPDDNETTHPVAEPAAPPALDPTLEGWTAAGAGHLFEFFGVALNALARVRGGGPEDVYLVRDEEAELFGEAAASWANRHARVRQLAGAGEVAIMAGTVGQWAIRETGRAAAYAEAQRDAAEPARPAPVIRAEG